jgi:phosphatidylethanolamine/phosphatidyl-N-methylethanolamine N-methyltransferase
MVKSMTLPLKADGAIDEMVRWDRQAPTYDFLIKPTEWIVGRRRARLLAEASGNVLEIGVGTGRTFALYRPDVRLSGIDLSTQMLDHARQTAERLGRQVELRQMGAEELHFSDDSFDCVVTSLVFCSVGDPARALAEIRRVLRPGGRLLMLEHVRAVGRLGNLFDRLEPWYYRQSCHLNRETAEDVRRAGFEAQHEERWVKGAFMALAATKPG